MTQKAAVLLLQLVKALKGLQWTTDTEWELSLKSDGYVSLVRPVVVVGSLDGEQWKDQVHTMIRLTIASDDDITFFPEFTVYAQVAIGEIPSKDIDYKMAANDAFTQNDLKNDKKAVHAAKQITQMTEGHLGETYQDYVDQNEDLVKFYKQTQPPQ